MQFLINVVKVNLYGALGVFKPTADILIRKAIRNQKHDLPLSDCQKLSQPLARRPPFAFTFECCIDPSQGQPLAAFRDLDRSHPDPPPLKWSDLRYVFDIQEDCNGKE